MLSLVFVVILEVLLLAVFVGLLYFDFKLHGRILTPSTNCRVVISVIFFACIAIDMLEMIFVACIGLFTLCFRFHRSQRCKFMFIDDSLRITILVFVALLFFPTSISISFIVVVELLTFVNPVMAWKHRDKIRVPRPTIFLISMYLGHFLFVCSCITMYKLGLEQLYVSFPIFIPVLIYVNNEYAVYMSAVDERIANRPATLDWMDNSNPNEEASAGIQCLNMFQVAVTIYLSFVAILSRIDPEQACFTLVGTVDGPICAISGRRFAIAARSWDIAFCLLVLLRTVIQQTAFSDSGSHRHLAITPYKNIEKTSKKILAFVTSWKGQHIVSCVNFGVNAIFFLIAACLGLYPAAAGGYIKLIFGLSLSGCLVNINSFVFRRSKWKSWKKIFPADDSMRLTILCKNLILGFKTTTIVITSVSAATQTTPGISKAASESADVALVILTIASLLVIGVTTTVDIMKVWSKYSEIKVPNPRVLLVGYVMLLWGIQFATIVVIIVSKKFPDSVCSRGKSAFFKDYDEEPEVYCGLVFLGVTASIMAAVMASNELARYLQTYLDGKEETGNVGSLLGLVSFNPILILVCGTAIGAFTNQPLVIVICGGILAIAVLVHVGTTRFCCCCYCEEKKHSQLEMSLLLEQ